MLAKAKADEKLNIGEAADQKRLYNEYIEPVLQRGRRINARQERSASVRGEDVAGPLRLRGCP